MYVYFEICSGKLNARQPHIRSQIVNFIEIYIFSPLNSDLFSDKTTYVGNHWNRFLVVEQSLNANYSLTCTYTYVN